MSLGVSNFELEIYFFFESTFFLDMLENLFGVDVSMLKFKFSISFLSNWIPYDEYYS